VHRSSTDWKHFGCAPPDKRIAFVRDEFVYPRFGACRESHEGGFSDQGQERTNRDEWQVWGTVSRKWAWTLPVGAIPDARLAFCRAGGRHLPDVGAPPSVVRA
jgi:hypothetical protein